VMWSASRYTSAPPTTREPASCDRRQTRDIIDGAGACRELTVTGSSPDTWGTASASLRSTSTWPQRPRGTAPPARRPN
jgi:hypothetical protein